MFDIGEVTTSTCPSCTLGDSRVKGGSSRPWIDAGEDAQIGIHHGNASPANGAKMKPSGVGHKEFQNG
jgi:hypothetical protein